MGTPCAANNVTNMYGSYFDHRNPPRFAMKHPYPFKFFAESTIQQPDHVMSIHEPKVFFGNAKDLESPVRKKMLLRRSTPTLSPNLTKKRINLKQKFSDQQGMLYHLKRVYPCSRSDFTMQNRCQCKNCLELANRAALISE